MILSKVEVPIEIWTNFNLLLNLRSMVSMYINIIDNTNNHGPGSQGSATEADGCFGKVLEGFDVIDRIKKHPKTANMGFINGHEDQINISSMKLLTAPVKV